MLHFINQFYKLNIDNLVCLSQLTKFKSNFIKKQTIFDDIQIQVLKLERI